MRLVFVHGVERRADQGEAQGGRRAGVRRARPGRDAGREHRAPRRGEQGADLQLLRRQGRAVRHRTVGGARADRRRSADAGRRRGRHRRVRGSLLRLPLRPSGARPAAALGGAGVSGRQAGAGRGRPEPRLRGQDGGHYQGAARWPGGPGRRRARPGVRGDRDDGLVGGGAASGPDGDRRRRRTCRASAAPGERGRDRPAPAALTRRGPARPARPCGRAPSPVRGGPCRR